jgi:hypothetical protein
LQPEISVISPTDLTGSVWICEPVVDVVPQAKLVYYLSKLLIALGA